MDWTVPYFMPRTPMNAEYGNKWLLVAVGDESEPRSNHHCGALMALQTYGTDVWHIQGVDGQEFKATLAPGECLLLAPGTLYAHARQGPWAVPSVVVFTRALVPLPAPLVRSNLDTLARSDGGRNCFRAVWNTFVSAAPLPLRF